MNILNFVVKRIVLVFCAFFIVNSISFSQQERNESYVNESFHSAYKPTFKSDGKNKKVKNVILMIGDGMGFSQLSAGMYANKNELSITNILNMGMVKTNAAGDDFITDSAAAGTAFATGNKTKNGVIGMDENRQPLKNMTEILWDRNFATGIVSTDKISGATPASFYAHQPNRNMFAEILEDLTKSKLDIFVGGSVKHIEVAKIKIAEELTKNNFTVTNNYKDIEKLTKNNRVGIIAHDDDVVAVKDGRGDFLPFSTKYAIEFLKNKKKKKGFFLMVEAAQIDWGGHRNDTEYVVSEMLDFDKAISEALMFADKDGETLVIITADHETGGFGIRKVNLYKSTINGQFITLSHTPVMVPLFAYGPQSYKFRGVMQNSDVFHIIINSLK